jgi:glycine betaine/proline transport system substrate-binding protein
MRMPFFRALIAIGIGLMLGGASIAQDAGPPAMLEPGPPQPPPPVCGTQPITIARMIWPSAELLAAIHARILETQFGCTVKVQPGDMAATVSAMGTTGQPAVAPEVWVDRIADIWNQAVKSQKVRPSGTTYRLASFEGWFIPDYLAEAHPELRDVASLRAHADWFAVDGQRPRFISCPLDWACSVINRNLLKADGLDTLFDLVTPKNRFELDNAIAEAVGRKQPILFYYWQPNAVLAQFGFKAIDLGPFNRDNFACLGRRDCPDPKPSSYAPEPVLTALSDWVYTDTPEIAAYFQRASMPIEEMNALLERLNQPGATVDTVADAFIANRQQVWRHWVGDPPSGGK